MEEGRFCLRQPFLKKKCENLSKKNGEFAILYRTNHNLAPWKMLTNEIFHIEFMADCLLST
jgi:hypothetical protein